MEKERRHSTLSRTLGAVAITGALFVPLALYGAPALARSAAAAHEYSGKHSHEHGKSSDDDEGSSSAQYQYTPPGCFVRFHHHQDGIFASFGRRANRGHHHGIKIAPCSTTSNQQGDSDNDGDDGGSNHASEHFGATGPSHSGHEDGPRKG